MANNGQPTGVQAPYNRPVQPEARRTDSSPLARAVFGGMLLASFPIFTMSRPETTARKIAGAKPRLGKPAKGKATSIRTARDRDQAVKRLTQEVVNLTLYGVPASRLLAHVADVIDETEESMEE